MSLDAVGLTLLVTLGLAGLAVFRWMMREIERDEQVRETRQDPVLGRVEIRRRDWSAHPTLGGHLLHVTASSIDGPGPEQLACWGALVTRWDETLAEALEALAPTEAPALVPVEVWLTDRIGGVTLLLARPGSETHFSVSFEDWLIEEATELH